MRLRWVGFYGVFLSMAMMLASSPVRAVINDSGIKTAWGYKGNVGPEFWGRLSPAFKLCSEGHSQSPIDISKNDASAINTLIIKYSSVPLAVVDNGTTMLQIGNQHTIINDGHTVQINFHDTSRRELISYQNQDYQLKQFHFHSPSENQLNGEAAPLEIHFVHQGKNGKVAIIGVFVKGGNSNPELQVIIDHLPKIEGKEYIIKNQLINPGALMPLDNDYYSFPGSLTTPPCTEGLQWIVMAGTISASPAQIAMIRKAVGGSNARAVQSLNDRLITYSSSSEKAS